MLLSLGRFGFQSDCVGVVLKKLGSLLGPFSFGAPKKGR